MSEPNGDEPVPSSSSPTASPCQHLRSKGMYVQGDGSFDDTEQDYDCSQYWCLRTSRDLGPDHGFVNRDDCRDAGRPCYEPY